MTPIITGFSQENTIEYKNEIRLDAIELFRNTFMLTYERNINDKSSVQLSAGVILKENDSEIKNGGIVEIQYRLNRNMKRRVDTVNRNIVVYGAPFLKYRYLDATSTSYFFYTNNLYQIIPDYSRKLYYFSTISFGGLVGVKISFYKHIFIDLNFGGGIKYTKTNGFKTDNMADEAYTGVSPVGNITFGFKF